MKRTYKPFSFPVTLLALCVSSITTTASQEQGLGKLPKYQTPVPYAGIRNWHVTQNLGPTGARGWVYGHTNHTRDSREILIKSVEPGSPADGILRPYDIIVGAAVPPDSPSTEWKRQPAVKRFDSDARMSLARAITWAESKGGGGLLKLLRQRDGSVVTVSVRLPVMGDYSKTAPFDCPKSERIVEQAADFLARNMPVEGYRAGVPSPLAAAFLLASGDDRYLDHVRRSANQMALNHTISDAGHETWRWGNTNTFLAEYYLATGDKRVLPQIEAFCKVLAEGQCNPGTWGHRAVPDFIPPGYGSLNSTGVVCFLSMILGWQAGVDVDEEAIKNSIRFYGSYAGRGGIPYGDHPPSTNASSNGKNGMAAIAFGQLGAEPSEQWFAQLAASSNLAAFEGGHTGNYFNQTWTPLGAYLAGRENYINFWARFNSYRDLARRRDGSFMTQPLPNTREGDLGSGNYVSKGPMWTTGGFALSYLAGTERLAMLGRKDSVFAANPPAELKAALVRYHAKDFEASSRMAKAVSGKSKSERVLKLAKQLAEAAQRNLRSIDLTLESMEQALAVGDYYKLKHQLLGIESVVDIDDERLEPYLAAVNDPVNEPALSEGAKFYSASKGAKWSGPLGFQIVAPPAQVDSRARGNHEQLVKDGKAPYKAMAQAYLEAHPELVLNPNMPLIPPPSKAPGRGGQVQADSKAKPWRYFTGDKLAGDDWTQASFNDSNWKQVALPSKEVEPGQARSLRGMFQITDPDEVKALSLDYASDRPFKVFLNGNLVMDHPGGKTWKRTTAIQLKPSTLELLRAGSNLVAVEAEIPASGQDFILELRAIME